MPDHRNLSKKNSRRGYSPWRLVILLCILVLSGSIWGLIFLNGEQFALRTIEVRGNQQLSATAIAVAVREALAGERAWFLHRDRYWFYSPEQLTASLGARFGRLASIDVQTPDWQTLWLEISERKTTALWCPTTDCFYLDETGLAFAPAPHFSTPPFVVIAGPESLSTSTWPRLKSQPLSRSVFFRLLNLKLVLENFFEATALKGVQVNQIRVTADGDYRFRLNDFDLLMAATQSTDEILNLLRTVFTVPVFNTELALGTKLESLDLRFGQKVFYRFHE